jgi:hypothetical protein
MLAHLATCSPLHPLCQGSVTRIGSAGSNDIQLYTEGILEEHCVLEVSLTSPWLSPDPSWPPCCCVLDCLVSLILSLLWTTLGCGWLKLNNKTRFNKVLFSSCLIRVLWCVSTMSGLSSRRALDTLDGSVWRERSLKCRAQRPVRGPVMIVWISRR